MEEAMQKLSLLLLAIFSAVLSTPLAAQATNPSDRRQDELPYFKGNPSTKDKEDPNGRTLTGVVTDEKGQPLSGAIVSIKNLRSQAKRSRTTAADGKYFFEGTSRSADYEVNAAYKNAVSEIKKLSQYDAAKSPRLNLRIDTSRLVPSGDSAREGEFRLKRFVLDGNRVALPETPALTLLIGDENRVSGFAGVNRYSGQAEIQSDGKVSWKAPGFVATKRAGPAASMELETKFLDALRRTSHVSSSSTTVIFDEPGGKTVLEFAR
jgi:heat shock protein HslJ